MSVELVCHMGGDLLVVNAARASKGKVTEVMRPRDEELIRRLMRDGHSSPFDHPQVTFRIEAPEKVAAQHMRHRTQHYSQYSTRYSEVSAEHGLYEPLEIRRDSGEAMGYVLEETPIDQLPETEHAHTWLVEAMKESLLVYRQLVAIGMAREQASYVLPMGLMTSYYATGSLRSWFNFLRLRNAAPALKEIRLVAQEIEEHVKTLFPVSWAAWNEKRETL